MVGVQVQGSWRAGSGEVYAVALAGVDESACWVDVEQIGPEDDAVLAGWLADPAYPKVLHDAKGPMLALAARGWTLAGLARDTALSAYLAADQRSYDLADLTVRYLKRELKIAADDEGQLSFDSVVDDGGTADTAMLHAWTVLELASALDEELDERGGPVCSPTSSCRSSTCWPSSKRIGVAVDVPQLEGLEAHFAGEVEEGGRGGVRGHRQGDQPGLAQALSGSALRRAEDEAHQDRLHHRRRRPAGALRQDRAPVPAAPAPAPRDVSRLRQTVEGLLKTVASDGRIHTTFNQTIAATAALLDRTSRTSRSAPKRPIRDGGSWDRASRA